jgi:hypothetical protein
MHDLLCKHFAQRADTKRMLCVVLQPESFGDTVSQGPMLAVPATSQGSNSQERVAQADASPGPEGISCYIEDASNRTATSWWGSYMHAYALKHPFNYVHTLQYA